MIFTKEKVSDFMIGLTLTEAINGKNSFIGIASNFGIENLNFIGGHSAIIIYYNLELYTFHYNSKEVLLQKLDEDVYNSQNVKYFHGQVDFIAKGESEVAAFLARCKFLKSKTKPQFGFIFDESHYDINTGVLKQTNLPDFCTCVGFCLKVINGVLKIKSDKDYLNVKTWENIDVEHPSFKKYLYNLVENNNDLNVNNLALYHKRIRPCEFAISSLVNIKAMPIDRPLITNIYDKVKTEILQKYVEVVAN